MPDNDFTRKAGENTTAIASSLDTVATRGAARTWLAAIIRILALWYGLPALTGVPSDLLQLLGRIVYRTSAEDTRTGLYYTLDSMKEVWDMGGGRLAHVLIWALVAWKAGRIAVWVFPLQRCCLRCGYTIGRVSKTTPATPCPECGEGGGPSADDRTPAP